jgi:hypothetical protein|tara:strand:+ start:18305 stop:18523 length:219 start_codon:yes stop_codon:yes gene_type:complete
MGLLFKTPRQKVVARLLKKAALHVRASTIPDHLDCGRAMASQITGVDYAAEYDKAMACLNRLRRVDPHLPRL